MRLRNGLTRVEAGEVLAEVVGSSAPVAIGLDFAFSFPEWYLTKHNLNSARELWILAAEKGEEWLNGNTWPFWGRKGVYEKRPKNLGIHLQFRQTDAELRAQEHSPKSVFQVFGGGAVGTGSIRGFPLLTRLWGAGASIWPFDAPESGRSIVVEIYPRLFYGNRITNNGKVVGRDSRGEFLKAHYPELEQHWQDIMLGNQNAFDAGVSALVMSKHAEEFGNLSPATDPTKQLEGEIWRPCL